MTKHQSWAPTCLPSHWQLAPSAAAHTLESAQKSGQACRLLKIDLMHAAYAVNGPAGLSAATEVQG